jgi:hypothetical protein
MSRKLSLLGLRFDERLSNTSQQEEFVCVLILNVFADARCVFLQASEMEIIWVMRGSIIVVGILSTIMALTIPSIYGLW